MFVGSSFTGLFRPEHADAFDFIGFGGVGRTGALEQAGVLELHPVHFGSLPGLISVGPLPVDVVLAQAQPARRPTAALARPGRRLRRRRRSARARMTIAEVNPHVPFTFGDTSSPPIGSRPSSTTTAR